MKTIIAGSRRLGFKHVCLTMVLCPWKPTVVISGTAYGVDSAGEVWAAHRDIPVLRMPANWDLNGRTAGYIRNQAMAEVGEALVAVWDGHSRGTKHMIDIATRRGLTVFVWTPSLSIK